MPLGACHNYVHYIRTVETEFSKTHKVGDEYYTIWGLPELPTIYKQLPYGDTIGKMGEGDTFKYIAGIAYY